MPMPKFEPTDEQREMVMELASLGVRHEDITRFIKKECGSPIGVDTLKKYFSHELEMGRIEANAKVAATLFKMATSGDQPAATFFWLKTRAQWRETPQQVAFTDADGNSVNPPSLADLYSGIALAKAKPQPEPEQSKEQSEGGAE